MRAPLLIPIALLAAGLSMLGEVPTAPPAPKAPKAFAQTPANPANPANAGSRGPKDARPADGKTAPERPGLRWDSATDRYEASIPGWTVQRVLSRLRARTGWRVWIEDGVQAQVRTRFRNLPAREALPRLLGGLNYSLTTGGDGLRELKVFATQARSSTREVLADAGDGTIGDELIVRSKSGAPLDPTRLAALKGASLVGTNGLTGAYRLRFASDEQAEQARQTLASESGDLEVENNQRFEAPEDPVPVNGVGAPPLRLSATVRPDGTRRVIALIDTAPQGLSPEFQSFLLPTVDLVPGVRPGTGPSHGTSMAEAMVRGLGAGASETSTRIQPYNVYGAGESASTWDVAAGVARAAQDGATIINLSLGSPQDSSHLRAVIRQVTDQGALVVAAAGNSGSTEAFFPAAYDEALAVTAAGRSGQLAPYANRGSFVDLAMPGSTVVETEGRSWVVQGTSVSAAYASGMAGALAQNPQAPLGPVRNQLIQSFPIQSGKGP
jgi:thermitase